MLRELLRGLGSTICAQVRIKILSPLPRLSPQRRRGFFVCSAGRRALMGFKASLTRLSHGWIGRKGLAYPTARPPGSHPIRRPFYLRALIPEGDQFTARWLDVEYRLRAPVMTGQASACGCRTPISSSQARRTPLGPIASSSAPPREAAPIVGRRQPDDFVEDAAKASCVLIADT
jgi:hypothetical protein